MYNYGKWVKDFTSSDDKICAHSFYHLTI